ncbi:30S ribosomal protein S19 [Candidatus Peregrinibacteria bacterium]|jgi:small subunit ribosomal protein S19|nr:30S ribosomal protein S19 [Candidatus Peregrinibacteria bacterium]
MAEELARKSKDKFFRGKNVEDLKELSTRNFAKLVKARSRRTIMRNYDVIEAFVKKVEDKAAKGKLAKTQDRSLVIVPRMVGNMIGIHNGKEFTKILITHEMLGHRLGEFSMTRKIAKHTSLGKKK